MIKDSYKQVRHNDDENQPLSVQHWGLDGDKRRYFLIEGQDDTPFRVYRQAHWYGKNAQWYNMAGSIEEIRVLAEKLDKEDGSQRARTFGQRMLNAIPRFEATEEVRDHDLSESSRPNLQPYRNAADANTARLVVLHSTAQNLASACTRDAPAASAHATISTMMMSLSPTQLPPAAPHGNLSAIPLPRSDLPTQPVDVRSELDRAVSTAPAC